MRFRAPARRRLAQAALALATAVALQGCRCAEQEAIDVAMDPRVQFQTFEGFGTAMIGWGADFREYYDRPEFRRWYLDELGATVLRVELSGDGVPERERWQDISHADFALDGVGERGGRNLRLARELSRASNGRLRVIASVWSPPAWMKVNRSKGSGHPERRNFALSAADLGLAEGVEPGPRKAPPDEATRERYLLSNKLRRDRYPHFAKTLVEWVRAYRAHGVELFALSPQNEPRFSHWFGSAVYSPEELAEVAEAIVSMFEAEGEAPPRLFAPETMMHDTEGNRAYLDALLGSDTVAPRLHALAVHGYVDGYQADQDPKSPRRFFDLAAKFEKPIWFTEGGTGAHEWPAPLAGFAAGMINALASGHASLITPWQAVDSVPNQHCLMPLAGPTKKTALARQLFAAVRPGMRRVKAETKGTGMEVVAFAEQLGSSGESTRQFSLVLLHRGRRSRSVRIRLPEGSAYVVSAQVTDEKRSFSPLSTDGLGLVEVPASSVVTLRLERR